MNELSPQYNPKEKNKNKSAKNCYLEIKIQENGELIFMPLSNDTSSVFKSLRNDSALKDLSSFYCG